MRKIVLVAAILLAGCSTTPPPIDIQNQCLPQTLYFLPDQQKLASEIAALDKSGKYPETLRALADYHAMRMANEACRAASVTLTGSAKAR